jgi:hypothetical protein
MTNRKFLFYTVEELECWNNNKQHNWNRGKECSENKKKSLDELRYESGSEIMRLL